MEKALNKREVISELSKSVHGKLMEYTKVGLMAAKEDPEFYAHLIAWDAANGQVRDAHVALPVVSLKAGWNDRELTENSLAHLAMLSPRDLVRATEFNKEFQTTGHKTGQMVKLVKRYLRAREQKFPWWEKSVVQHRDSMKTLYAKFHVRPSGIADMILFKEQYPEGTVFRAIRDLATMGPEEAAREIITRKIPFLIAIGAAGKNTKEQSFALALIKGMSPTELVTNTKLMEKLGVKTDPVLRGAYEEALGKAGGSKKATFKTTRAAEATTDEKLKARLQGLQERQLENLKGVEGDWLVIGDMSGSMSSCIETARQIAGAMSKMVKGKIHLIFSNVGPKYYDVTGKAYDEILAVTKRITAEGGTSLGCGLEYLLEKGIEVDGVAIVSDGEENTAPFFVNVWHDYGKKFDKQVPVYFYKMGNAPVAMHHAGVVPYLRGDTLTAGFKAAGMDLPTFNLGTGNVDYYSLPNIISTMRVSKYSLVDEVMATKLKTVEEVLGGS